MSSAVGATAAVAYICVVCWIFSVILSDFLPDYNPSVQPSSAVCTTWFSGTSVHVVAKWLHSDILACRSPFPVQLRLGQWIGSIYGSGSENLHYALG